MLASLTATAIPALASSQVCPSPAHEWGSTGEWWQGGDDVVLSNFHYVHHGCDSDLESASTE